jgi:hypothetical protein
MPEPDSPHPPAEPAVAEELRALGQAVASLARAAFRSGRALSVEALRGARQIVDRAREEIEKLTG